MGRSFPRYAMGFAEGSIGWVPYLLERADFDSRHHNAWPNADFAEKCPPAHPLAILSSRHFITWLL